jgi:cell division protease FtsH
MYSGRGGDKRSEYTSQIIDQEIERFVQNGYKLAVKILTENISQLHIVAKALLEHETLTGQQINNLISGREMNKDGELLLKNKTGAKDLEAKKPAKPRSTAKKKVEKAEEES